MQDAESSLEGCNENRPATMIVGAATSNPFAQIRGISDHAKHEAERRMVGGSKASKPLSVAA